MINVVLLNIDPRFEDINNKYLKKCNAINVVAVFDNSADVEKHLETNKVDAVFIDCDLNSFNVPAFIKHIKDRQLYTQFIVTTVTDDTYEITKIEYAGVYDVVVKPFSYAYFLKVVDSLEKHISSGGTLREFGSSSSVCISEEDMSQLEVSVLSAISDKAMTVSELSKEFGISRIVTRKIINALLLKRALDTHIDDASNAVVKYRKKQLF